jgi:hypothetical protein
MKIILLLIILLPFFSFSQQEEGLTAEERAYLFHIVKKSPILDTNMGRYFDYKGPMIKFPNKSINYDSIETLIMFNPEILVIRKEEIGKTEKGLIGEATNKMALWELNKILLAKREGEKELEPYLLKYRKFEKLLVGFLPPNALKSKDGEIEVNRKLESLINPSLAFDDKLTFLESFHFLTENDKLVTLKAMNSAVNAYVEMRSLEIYRSLGGEAEVFQNVLVAAGDGSSTSGVLEEREKDEKGRWNKGLPKAVGLFPYQVEVVFDEKRKENKIEPVRFTVTDFKTIGNNKMTNLHFDVWGYNGEKQTTVVIEKNGLSYHLFGSEQTRFLSPDSTFSDGATFQAMINDLEFNKVARLNDMIHGKKGFDYLIAYNEKKKDQTELEIVKHEKIYSDLGYRKTITQAKMSKKVKKQKKNTDPNKHMDFQPTTVYDKDKRKYEQEMIIGLYRKFEEYKLTIKELKEKKVIAVDLMATYQRRLDHYKQLMGLNWAKYTEKGGLYTFQDSTTFDIFTQEFQFKESKESEDFEVRLLAIPQDCLSDDVDEVMLHINLIDATPYYDSRLQLELNDVFESDKYDLSRSLFTENDSVAIRQFFEGLLNKKMKFSIQANGQGIGVWNGARTVKNNKPLEELSYKGSRMDSTYLRLRKSELFVSLDRDISVEVNSYTDPVGSALKIDDAAILELMAKYKLSKNDILSVYRTATILKKMKQELNVYAGVYLDRVKAKQVIDRFNKEMNKVKINVGITSIKLNSLK